VSGSGRLILGTAQWGIAYGIANRTGTPTPTEVASIAKLAWTAGVRGLDTARAYGRAEEVIGSLQQPWQVMTKLSPDVAGEGMSEADARARTSESLARSREALKRDVLATVLLHRAIHRTQSGGAAWDVLQAERRAGGIGAIGASVIAVEEVADLFEASDVEVMQVPASLLDQRLFRSGFFDEAARAGRRVVARSIYLQGVAHLAVGDLPAHLAELSEPLTMLDRRARALGITRADLFLSWARYRLPAVGVLVGCESVRQLRQNLRAWERPVAEQEIEAIEAAVPELPDRLLDPWRWPAMRPGA
jgi:aryl-alcohol dehydrogenase-like predicted oxidoreductase